MASYAIAADERAAYAKALAAATEDTVTFTGSHREQVSVTLESGTTPIYFTTDGTAAVVAAAKAFRVPAVAGTAVTVSVPTGGPTVVRLISSGACTYSVVGSL